MRREDLADLAVLLVVSEEGGFTRAAKKLGLSQSALSHTIRRLEARLGLRLLTRTTRSVALTEAGEQLLAVLQPALADMDERLAELTRLRERPAGTIRISTSEYAAETILWPAVDRITRQYPEIHVELNIEGGFIDIVSERFDAGVRLGEALAKDMVAVRISPPQRMAAFASPEYLQRAGVPATPQELARHQCINMRFGSDLSPMPWEFTQGGRDLKIKVDGPLVFNRPRLVIAAAVAGKGIGYFLEEAVLPSFADGSLVRVLDDWCEPFDGYYLYYPMRRQASSAFRVLVEALRYPA